MTVRNRFGNQYIILTARTSGRVVYGWRDQLYEANIDKTSQVAVFHVFIIVDSENANLN